MRVEATCGRVPDGEIQSNATCLSKLITAAADEACAKNTVPRRGADAKRSRLLGVVVHGVTLQDGVLKELNRI